MKFFVIYISLVLFLLLGCTKTNPPVAVTLPAAQEPAAISYTEPEVIKVGDLALTTKNLKTELESIVDLDSMSIETAKNYIIKRQLMLIEAKKLGYESDPEFEEEFDTYRKIITDKELYSKEDIDKLKEESFENYQKELNLSLIFVPISVFAKAEDTLKLYKHMLDLRNNALKNLNFEDLALEFSKDPISAPKGGKLGWISNLQIIYPLESAAFKLAKDSISLPIRTKMGYNLLKLNDSRENSGLVKVQHILKYIGNNATQIEISSKETLMDSLKTVLDNGGSFDELCEKYSDDNNSNVNNGILPVFGIGTREEPIFEETAFSLKINEISKPIKTSNGIHILKLIEKYKPIDKTAYFQKIASKITTDSRGEYLKKNKIEELKKNQNYTLNFAEYNQCINTVDESILTRKWAKPLWTNNELFNLNNKSYKSNDFFGFIIEKQKTEKWPKNLKTEEVTNYLFYKYLEGILLKNNQQNLSTSNADIDKLLFTEKEDLLISKLRNDLIIEKSISDSIGLRNFYNSNKDQFKAIETAKVKKVAFDSESTFQKFNVLRSKEKPYQLNRGIAPFYYLKNQAYLENEPKRRLIGLISIMKKNPNYKVEIAGHCYINEIDTVSMARIKNIVDFLIENGLPLTRILEIDNKNSKPAEKFDWLKNQRVTFQFFSDSEIDLIKAYNAKYPNAISVSINEYSRPELEEMKIKWENGTMTQTKHGKVEEYTVKIKNADKINSFYQNRAAIINAYQDYLENQIINKLTAKYKITIDNEAVKNTIYEIKKEK